MEDQLADFLRRRKEQEPSAILSGAFALADAQESMARELGFDGRQASEWEAEKCNPPRNK